MFIFRFLEFLFKIGATLMIVVSLQIQWGEKTIEDRLLSFLRKPERLKGLKSFVHESQQVVQNEVSKYIQEQLKTRALAQQDSKNDLLSQNSKENLLNTDDPSFFQKILGLVASKYMMESHQNVEEGDQKIEDDSKTSSEKSSKVETSS